MDSDEHAMGFLAYCGLPCTREHRLFLAALARARRPAAGLCNPWGIDEPAPHSLATWPRDYPSERAGWAAVWAALNSGEHDAVLAELAREGTSAQALARVWDLTPSPLLEPAIDAARAER